jgi:hypothetical protein
MVEDTETKMEYFVYFKFEIFLQSSLFLNLLSIFRSSLCAHTRQASEHPKSQASSNKKESQASSNNERAKLHQTTRKTSFIK